MWWKAYFWIYSLLTLIGLFSLLEYAPLFFVDFVGILLNLVFVFALYNYTFKKKIGDKKYWYILFWISVFLFLEEIIELYFLPSGFIASFMPFLKSNVPLSLTGRLFSWLMSAPAVFALYKLSRK